MTENVAALILRAPGTNCDRETVRALELAGARCDSVHVDRICTAPGRTDPAFSLDPYGIVAVPGGFTYGDDLGAGVILGNRIARALGERLAAFVDGGGIVLGICNGFQVLVQAGLLPGPDLRGAVTLAPNRSGRFECRWVHLEGATDRSPLLERGAILPCPVAHAEGRLAVRDPGVLDELERGGQIAFRYVRPGCDAQPVPHPFNPNGSAGDVAGICDPTGRVLGLMPHPERNVEPFHDPLWTRRRSDDALHRPGPGLELFRRAVAAAPGAADGEEAGVALHTAD